MKKLFRSLLALTLVLLVAFSSVTVVSAASVAKVTSLQAYNIDDDEINLKWKKVKNADGYQVYMYKSGEWKRIGTTKNLKFEVDDLTSAKQYKFKVRAYDQKGSKKYYGSFSSVLLSATDPDEVEGLKASSKTKTTITLKWEKEKRATGYQVYIYSSSKNKYVKRTVVKSNSATIKDLKAGKTYKFKVRAYFKSEGKYYYGEFSDVLSVKTVANASSSKSPSSSSQSVIGNSKASSIALNHAKLKKSQVRDFECKLDVENGIKVYEVDFEYGKYDYEYDINAKTGKIIRWEKDAD
ncbi:MAG: fibronectin type III domain-containing protein [Acutalibacteraceae bacterium]|nr:fibronectin type III domain-containing protein [Acutalibacteraceae bacterium]